jgi:hypothetical protein
VFDAESVSAAATPCPSQFATNNAAATAAARLKGTFVSQIHTSAVEFESALT